MQPFPTNQNGDVMHPWAPAWKGVAVTKSDATVVAFRALWVGGAGDVAVIFAGDQTNSGSGTAVTISSVPAGTLLPFAVKKVMSTNTTATLIVGLS